MKTKNRITFAKSGIDAIRAEISFFIPGKALIVFSGLNILNILKDLSLTDSIDSSSIL